MKQEIVFLSLIICTGCMQDKKERAVRTDLNYAKEFSFNAYEDFTLLNIDEPWQGSNRSYRYILHTSEDFEFPDSLSGAIPIKVPVQSIASNSTTHLPMLESLGADQKLKGFAQTQFISSDTFNERLDRGDFKEIGHNAQVNLEIVMDLNPEVFLAFNTSNDNRRLNQLERNNINVVYIADYKEASVLGRAEWIKVIGLLVGKFDRSEEYFDQLVLSYDSLTDLANAVERPTVLSGTLYGGTWFAPNGENYNSHLIKDAGGSYIFEDEEGSGWLNLDFEVVYSQGWDADFWIGASNFNSLDELRSMDERYGNFEAFKRGAVYTYTKRVNEKGANDYFESGQLNPDRLLADHIKILHPELLADYELYYYKKLE